MEGTKHEKITLVVLGYIIGAATIFLGTSITPANTTQQTAAVAVYAPELEIPTEPASDTTSTPAVEESFVNESTEMPTRDTLIYSENALRYVSSDNEVVLSIHESELSSKVGFERQGYHTETPVYAGSPDGSHVFFCEKHNVSDNVCSAFVYDVNRNSIAFVQNVIGAIEINTTTAKAAYWDKNALVISDYRSTNPDSPWIVE